MSTQNKILLAITSATAILFFFLTINKPVSTEMNWTQEELAILHSLRLPSKWEVSDPPRTNTSTTHRPLCLVNSSLLILN